MKKCATFFYFFLVISLLFSCAKESTSTPENDFIRATVNGNAYSSSSVVAVKNPGRGELAFFYSKSPDSVSIGLSLIPTVPAYAEGTYTFRPLSPQDIRLISFDVESNNFRPEISWTTTSTNDINLDYSIVESSQDGTNFVQVAIVDAVGNATGNTSYRYIDAANMFTARTFYRLKLVSADGSVIYSPVRLYVSSSSRAFYSNTAGSYTGYNGTITITSHNRQTKVVSGTFSFNVKDHDNQVKQIRNGSFRVSY